MAKHKIYEPSSFYSMEGKKTVRDLLNTHTGNNIFSLLSSEETKYANDKEVIKQEKQKIEKLKEETIKFSKEKIKTENIEETVKIACGDYVRIKDTSTEGIVSELIEEK